MANAFERFLITMGRVRYALHWPAYLRLEFVSLWQEVSTPRMNLFGWDPGPSEGGSPSKRYWAKVKRVVEVMKACWHLEREKVTSASPNEGPTGAAQERRTLGNWPSSDENGANRSRVPKAPLASSPVQFSQGKGHLSTTLAHTSSTPVTGRDARITAVMEREVGGSLTNPLGGWPQEDQQWPTTVGRCVHSDPIVTEGIGNSPAQVTRSNSDIMTRALTNVGAERVPVEEFWTLAELGDMATVLKGRGFEVWALPHCPICACRHEYHMGVRMGEKASGKLAQNSLMTLANTPPGIRLSSPRETLPLLASHQQVGLPAVAASDAQLGHSAYTYQSGEVAFGSCGAEAYVLWRVVGQHSRARGQTGSKVQISQRAKVGFCPCRSTVSNIAIPGSYGLGAVYVPKDVVMQLRQAFRPWGPRRYSASMYVAENGYLPRDLDWAASPLTVGIPSPPYLVSSSMGGICDVITRGAPPIPRTAPNFEDAPKMNPDAASMLRVAEGLANSPDQAHVSDEIRAPPAAPKEPPPIFMPPEQENIQTTEAPPDYQSDWYADWSASD